MAPQNIECQSIEYQFLNSYTIDQLSTTLKGPLSSRLMHGWLFAPLQWLCGPIDAVEAKVCQQIPLRQFRFQTSLRSHRWDPWLSQTGRPPTQLGAFPPNVPGWFQCPTWSTAWSCELETRSLDEKMVEAAMNHLRWQPHLTFNLEKSSFFQGPQMKSRKKEGLKNTWKPFVQNSFSYFGHARLRTTLPPIVFGVTLFQIKDEKVDGTWWPWCFLDFDVDRVHSEDNQRFCSQLPTEVRLGVLVVDVCDVVLLSLFFFRLTNRMAILIPLRVLSVCRLQKREKSNQTRRHQYVPNWSPRKRISWKIDYRTADLVCYKGGRGICLE